jgi:methionine sulfoxide reductase heme-binding subunit
MQSKNILTIAAAVFGVIAYALFAYAVKDSSIIWLMTRILGLISYALLFASISLGEIKLITKGSNNFTIFKHHHAISIASVVFVLAHFIAAFMDNYKWGRQLTAVQYLGFSYTDIWVTFLSIGTLSFYVMVLIALSSANSAMRALGFGKWRMIHVLGYIAYIMAYIHSVNLGTDLKTSSVAPVIAPAVFLSFALTLGLLAARVLNGMHAFSDSGEAFMAAAFITLLIILASSLASLVARNMELESDAYARLRMEAESVDLQQQYNVILQNDTITLRGAVSGVNYGPN